MQKYTLLIDSKTTDIIDMYSKFGLVIPKCEGMLYLNLQDLNLDSIRGQEWFTFFIKVMEHIAKYTVPQYGDKGHDQCSEFTEADFITQMKKYLNRYGKNSREGQQKLDLLKIAHYAGMLHAKLTEEEAELKRIINHE